MRYEFHLGKLITSSHALDAGSFKKRHRSIDGAFFMGEEGSLSNKRLNNPSNFKSVLKKLNL
ncbi:hypothetical protein ABUK73_07895 [Agrobacterium sp. BA1120]|uniref:hypothetical protein n=1 Tax=Agrobacterium sp. BA1120 TaxID=3228927 RepID=UPI003369E101